MGLLNKKNIKEIEYKYIIFPFAGDEVLLSDNNFMRLKNVSWEMFLLSQKDINDAYGCKTGSFRFIDSMTPDTVVWITTKSIEKIEDDFHKFHKTFNKSYDEVIYIIDHMKNYKRLK